MQDLRAASVQPPPGGVITPEYLDEVLAADPAIDLVVTPELATVPYFPLERDSLDALSPASIDGALVAAFGDVARAHGVHLMLGAHLGDAERAWNSAVLIGPGGEPLEGRTASGGSARRFSKVHLCDCEIDPVCFCESAYFAPGEDFVVWDTPLGTIGTLICYDRHFPESWSTLRAMGAEIVCVCTTSPVSTEPSFVAEMQGMALQLSVFVALANRVGSETLRTSGTATEFLGASCIVDPVGHLMAAAPVREPHALVVADLEAERLSTARSWNQFWEHRRPELYVADRIAAPASPLQPPRSLERSASQ